MIVDQLHRPLIVQVDTEVVARDFNAPLQLLETDVLVAGLTLRR
jgi:hypothetical protein